MQVRSQSLDQGNREDERDNVEGSSKKLCSSSVSQNDLFLSEPNQSTPSVNSSVHSDSKNPLKMGIGRRKNKVVDNDDPFAFPSDLIKHQPSKQTDEDMFISPTDKPKQAASTSKAETKIQSPSGDMFSFVSPLNNKGQATRKSSIDMFALSGQSTKRRREENTNLSRLHFDDDIDMGKQQKNPDSSDGCFINQQERLNRPKIHKKVKLDENDPFAFPNQMGRSTSDAVGDVFDFPVNVAINNSKSDSQFDTESKEMSFSKCKRGICMSQMNSSLDGPRICPEQQQKDGNKLVSESSVKQEQEDEINMNMRTSQNIEFKRLTVPKQAASKREGLEQKANCKNFKKFRKVFPLNRSIVPQIIGGSDLYVYEAPIKVKVEDWLNEVPNEAEDIEDW